MGGTVISLQSHNLARLEPVPGRIAGSESEDNTDHAHASMSVAKMSKRGVSVRSILEGMIE